MYIFIPELLYKNDYDITYIPTIEEMQCWYEDDLRREALKSLECENNKKIDGQGSFFKAFRRFEERNEKIPLDSKESNAYYKKYKAYVEGERANKGKKIQEIENLIEYERFFLRFERRVNRETNNYSCYGSNSATRYRVDRIEGLEKELETILKSSPEAWDGSADVFLDSLGNQSKRSPVLHRAQIS
jgi:hypothetical protein